MNMMEAVTAALSDVIGWAGTVLTAVITESGGLHALLPLWAVGIAISALMLGIRVMRGFAWGN